MTRRKDGLDPYTVTKGCDNVIGLFMVATVMLTAIVKHSRRKQ